MLNRLFLEYECQGHSLMIHIYFMNHMQGVHTLSRHSWRIAHLFLYTKIWPCFGFRAIWAIMKAFCGGKRTYSRCISTEAIHEWCTLLLCISYDMCKHLVDIIEESLISFYSQTYVPVSNMSKNLDILGWWTNMFVEYQYHGHTWMIHISFIYLIWCARRLGRHNCSVAHLLL